MINTRTSILEAVQNLITNNVIISELVSGGIWTGEIPEGQRMPYASLEIDSTDFVYTSRSPDLENTRFSIIFFATGAQALDNILDKIQSFISDSVDYDFSNDDELMYILPSRRTTRSEFTRDKSGNQIFTGVLMFEAGIFRN